jgi:hypothetical protein
MELQYAVLFALAGSLFGYFCCYLNVKMNGGTLGARKFYQAVEENTKYRAEIKRLEELKSQQYQLLSVGLADCIMKVQNELLHNANKKLKDEISEFKENTSYIQLANEIESNIILAGGRFGSFAFAEGLALCVGAKANVPNVWLAKIELKNVWWGK